MSVSGFIITSNLSLPWPSQFQKQLRLQEARRLMLGQNPDATSAAYRGYDDASHFNREYKRLGAPPMRDVELLQALGRRLVQYNLLYTWVV